MAAALMTPQLALSANLGQMTITSTLGQPLTGHIEVLDLKAGEWDSVAASMVDANGYNEQSATYLPIYKTVNWGRQVTGSGHHLITFSTKDAVSEPSINFLVKLSSKVNEVASSYKTKLSSIDSEVPNIQTDEDLNSKNKDTFVKLPSVKVQPKLIYLTKTENKAADEPADPEITAEPEIKSDKLTANHDDDKLKYKDEVYVVKAGDTILKISKKLIKDGVPPEILAASMFELNKKSFIKGNVNLIRVNSKLKIPSSSEMLKIERSDAIKMLLSHQGQWNRYQILAAETAPQVSSVSDRGNAGKLEKGNDSGAVKKVIKMDRVEIDAKAMTELEKLAAQKHSLEEDIDAAKLATEEADERARVLEGQIIEMRALLDLKIKQQKSLEDARKVKKVQQPLEEKPSNLNYILTILGVVFSLGLVGLIARKVIKKKPKQDTESLFVFEQAQ